MSRLKRKQLPQNGTVLLRPNALKFNLALLDLSLARDSLAEFVRQAWHIIEPTTPLLWNWHLDAICEHLEAVANADLFRLIVNLPPRSGKSLVTSVLWPAWVWTRQASTRWLCASYSASLAVKFSIDRRTVITRVNDFRSLVAISDKPLGVGNSIRKVRCREVDLPHAVMQPFELVRVVG